MVRKRFFSHLIITLIFILIASFNCFAINYTHDADCVGAWLFEEGAGDIANDSSFSGNDGTLKDIGEPAFVAETPRAFSSYATQYDNGDDKITIEEITCDEDCSIVLWLKPESVSGKLFLGKYDADNYVAIMNATTIRIQDNASHNIQWSVPAIELGEWFHLAITKDSESNWRCFVNGQESQTGAVNSPGPLYIDMIGQGYIRNYYDYAGSIDELAIFDRVLTNDEINEIYENGLISQTNNPPVLGAIGDKSVSESFSLSFIVSALDPEGGSLTYQASNLPSGATFDTDTQLFNWTPTYAQAGTYHDVTFQVSDGEYIDSETITIQVFDYTPEGMIGPEGGEVFSSDGKIKLTIPAGALDTYEPIEVLRIDNEVLDPIAPEGKNILSVVDCSPYGLTFNLPLTLTYTFDETLIPGTAVVLGYYDGSLDEIVLTGATSRVNADGISADFTIEHFSTYTALNHLIAQGSPLGGGVMVPLPDLFSGAFGHSVPLSVVPGRRNMAPSLSLAYKSSNANSWVGVGFNVTVPYIVRSTRMGPPTYNDETDTFYFVTDAGSTELVHLVDNLYQAKIESGFTRFYKEQGDYWRLVNKDGTEIYMGQDASAKETTSAGTFSWYLTRALDTNGNYIEYSYVKDQGKAYISRIDYTGHTDGILPTNSVEFFLEDRDDVASSYISGERIATAKRLKAIQARFNNEPVWDYSLNYQYSPDTGRSLLQSITQYASDGTALPTQVFSYQSAE